MDSDQVFDHRKFDGGALQGGTAPTKTPRDCIHGRLARSCEQCEAEREIADLERELAAARAALSLHETQGEPVNFPDSIYSPFNSCVFKSQCIQREEEQDAPSSQPAQGWKLVPVELLQLPPLTDAMYHAVRGLELEFSSGGPESVMASINDETLDEIWDAINTALRTSKAMLAAAPAAPTHTFICPRCKLNRLNTTCPEMRDALCPMAVQAAQAKPTNGEGG